MIRSAGTLCIAALLAAGQAAAATHVVIEKNEVAGTAMYSAIISAKGYDPFINEGYVKLFCFDDGRPGLDWHIGGRYSGSFAGTADKIAYRFDQEAPVNTVWGAVSAGPGLAEFYANLIVHRKLAITLPDFLNSSESFDLSDFRKKAGAKSPLARQCAKSLNGQ